MRQIRHIRRLDRVKLWTSDGSVRRPQQQRRLGCRKRLGHVLERVLGRVLVLVFRLLLTARQSTREPAHPDDEKVTDVIALRLAFYEPVRQLACALVFVGEVHGFCASIWSLVFVHMVGERPPHGRIWPCSVLSAIILFFRRCFSSTFTGRLTFDIGRIGDQHCDVVVVTTCTCRLDLTAGDAYWYRGCLFFVLTTETFFCVCFFGFLVQENGDAYFMGETTTVENGDRAAQK